MAIIEGSHSIILVHNHPSGDCYPSTSDISLTILEASKILGIPIMDHVIIGKEQNDYGEGTTLPHYSLRDNGLCDFYRHEDDALTYSHE